MEKEKDPVTQTEEKTEEPVTQTDDKTEDKAEVKTFTQEEVNAMLAKERKKIPSKEEMQKFNDWKESQKTEAEKQSELNQKMVDTTNENKQLKQENLVLKANVDKEFSDYVQFAVSKMDGDFEENLKEFLEKNPKYLQKSDTKEEKITDGVSVNKSKINSADDGVTAILKEKHPEAFE